MPRPDKNPVDLAYETLVQAILTNPTVSASVKQGNMIQFEDGESGPEKDNIVSSDLPEIVIYMIGFGGNLHSSSDSNKLTLSYRLDVSTGSFDSRVINNLIIGIWAALLNWKATIHTAVWDSRSFIKDVRVSNGPVGESDPKLNRQIRGWASMIGIEMDLYLSTETVINAYASG